MKGCKKDIVNVEWMKEMLNWDLFTHPKAEAFAKKTSNEEKIELALQWKHFMDSEEIFISFYEWNVLKEKPRRSCSKILIPQRENPICCLVQTLFVSDIGREIGRLKKSIRAQKNNIEQEQILQVEHKKYHVLIELKIQGIPFKLKALIDTGSDLNMLHKDIILVSLWKKAQALVVGLGNIPNKISFQIPEVVLCFQDYCLKLKFLLADIPIACILGTPFLAAVSPHGSTMVTKDRPGYFISVPSLKGKVVIKLPFVSTPQDFRYGANLVHLPTPWWPPRYLLAVGISRIMISRFPLPILRLFPHEIPIGDFASDPTAPLAWINDSTPLEL
jgi:hypothetical protein